MPILDKLFSSDKERSSQRREDLKKRRKERLELRKKRRCSRMENKKKRRKNCSKITSADNCDAE
ncbi:MAG: hypothetical protein IKM61_08005 [Eubacteriaceae bacterium]|nr:hypothetical protein [Eubacteriaceae bacterium]